MDKALRGTLVLLLSALLVASPLRACCDDFWSCAGAVASAGVSCVIEAALNAAKDLIIKAEGERDSTKSELEADLAASKTETDGELQNLKLKADTAVADVTTYAREAEKLVGDETGRLRTALTAVASQSVPKQVPTPSKAGPGTVAVMQVSQASLRALQSDQTLPDLLRRLRAEAADAKTAQLASGQKAAAARSGIAESDARIRALFAQTFLPAIASIIVTLYAAIENPFDIVSAIAAAIFDLNQAIVLVGQSLPSSVDHENTVKQILLHEPNLLADQAGMHAQKAKSILAAIQKAVRLQDATERHRVQSDLLLVLDHSAPGVASIGPKLPSFSVLLAFSKKLGPGLESLRSRLQGFSTRPPDIAPFRPKLAADFDSFFKGKPPADAKRKRDELLAEARRRFASDPKTLAAVVKLVNDEARARGVL